ncbi:helix-turn-helix transcriptional regulator [Cupriavidus sp. WGtm5]|uniref:helix-turn-helix transcriptional regulator n=1 Tax=Cupriavidus sp. WGtm5 TaxID=2919926 RepID=UPI002090BD42|nr:helix-turn-helix transcriptional regulator [Cupriavidus sp. WGtm5]MCO4889508.1 helix-turn-helix transcriptional regulator [Cupriavidus sp. WGtm5]
MPIAAQAMRHARSDANPGGMMTPASQLNPADADDEALIDDIYAAGLGEQPWQTVLHALRRKTGVRLVNLLTLDAISPWLAPVAVAGDDDAWTAAALQSYGTEFFRYDPALPIMHKWETGHWLDDVDVCSPRQQARDIFQQEFMRARGLEHWSALKLYQNGQRSGFMSFMAECDAPPLTEEQHNTIARLCRHVSRASLLGLRIRHLEEKALLAECMLESLDSAVWLLDTDRRVLSCNAAARTLMASQSTRLRVVHGRLIPEGCSESMQWQAACMNGLLSLLPAGTQGDAAHPLHFSLIRLPPGTQLARTWQRPLTLMTFRVMRGPGERVRRLLLVYGLSEAEASVCVLMCCDGLTPQDCADRRQVSIATIRTQIKSIYAKTNMQRHGDLVRLVLSL